MPRRLISIAPFYLLIGCTSILGISGDYEAADGAASNAFHSVGINHQSCAQELSCGDLSCCASPDLPGGTFPMGSDEAFDERPEHGVTVSAFQLDAFEVTVGRFRSFLQDFDKGWRPMDGAGNHPKISESGWQIAWEARLPKDRNTFVENLKCLPFKHTWTDLPAHNEQFPINCVNWHEAFAFCVWDGGRLPTEAEWEYAAAGGSENRYYPWGPIAPSCDELRNFCDDGADPSPFIAVGQKPKGNARWGHFDLAGSMWEWTFDAYDDTWYLGRGKTCVDCANVAPGTRADRGGSYYETETDLFRSSYRGRDFQDNRNDWLGFRCARNAP